MITNLIAEKVVIIALLRSNANNIVMMVPTSKKLVSVFENQNMCVRALVRLPYLNLLHSCVNEKECCSIKTTTKSVIMA